MDIHTRNSKNNDALRAVRQFRKERSADSFGLIDDHFHKYKNDFPYFGFIDVTIGDISFLMFSANDDLVAMTFFWFGPSAFESKSMDIWVDASRHATTVLDVGAFSGIYSFASATVNSECQITAFEPSRRTHGRLLMNSFANAYNGRIKAVNNALADREDDLKLLQFRHENTLGNGASLVQKDIPVTDSTETVRTVVLDDYCAKESLKPDLIKIDVEGAEDLVLAGMGEIISQHRPEMLIEITPKTAPGVKEVLDRHGYKSALIADQTGTVSDFVGAAKGVCNIFAHRPA